MQGETLDALSVRASHPIMVKIIETIDLGETVIQFAVVDSMPKMIITEGEIVLDVDLSNVKHKLYSAVNYMNLLNE